MAATELLAVGATAAQSADIVIANGEAATIGIKGYSYPASVQIQIKVDVTNYETIATLSSGQPRCIQAPGTYRLVRGAGVSCGAYRA